MPLSKLVVLTSIFPFCGFVFSVLYSLLYYFEESTFTHCKVSWKSSLRNGIFSRRNNFSVFVVSQVWNYLPSLSAAIGNYTTQYVVWCIFVTLHSPPRFLFALVYHRFYMRTLKQDEQRYVAKLACLLNVLENISLLGLSYWTSSESYGIHTRFRYDTVAHSIIYENLYCSQIITRSFSCCS